jgi:hypothetical protein
MKTTALLLITTLTLGLTACASTRPDPPDTVSLDIKGSGGTAFKVELSSDLVRDIVESALGSDLTCDGDLDEDMAALLQAIDNGRTWTSAEVRRGDEVLRARRRGTWLRLELGEVNGGALEVKMPWAVAECLWGQEATLADALRHHRGTAELEVRIKGESGGRFRLALE